MRYFLIVLLLWLAAIAAVVVLADDKAQGQQRAASNQVTIPSFNDHPQHAAEKQLSFGGETYVASGEGRVSIPIPPEEPLGDAARRLRMEHAKQPKAKKVYVSQ